MSQSLADYDAARIAITHVDPTPMAVPAVYDDWVAIDVTCPGCGVSTIEQNILKQSGSLPPKHPARCTGCGWVGEVVT